MFRVSEARLIYPWCDGDKALCLPLSERYVSGVYGEWDKHEGTEVELEGLKDAFVPGTEFGRANGYAHCIEADAQDHGNGISGWSL